MVGRLRTDRYLSSPIASVYANFATTGATGAYHKIQYDSVFVNDNGFYDFTNHQLVCPKAGLVWLHVVFGFFARTSNVTATVVEANQRNSAGVSLRLKRPIEQTLPLNNGSSYVFNGSDLFEVSVGDTISISYLSTSTIEIQSHSTFPRYTQSLRAYFLP